MSSLLRKADVVRHFGNTFAATGRACISPEKPNGLSKVAVRKWPEYVPELTARRLLDRYPELRDLVVDPASGLSIREMRDALARAPVEATERQA